MMLDPVVIRKINLLTSKQRPFCAFCKCLAGFTWQRYDPNETGESTQGYDLCMTCFAQDKYPAKDAACLKQNSLSKEHWESLEQMT